MPVKEGVYIRIELTENKMQMKLADCNLILNEKD